MGSKPRAAARVVISIANLEAEPPLSVDNKDLTSRLPEAQSHALYANDATLIRVIQAECRRCNHLIE